MLTTNHVTFKKYQKHSTNSSINNRLTIQRWKITLFFNSSFSHAGCNTYHHKDLICQPFTSIPSLNEGPALHDVSTSTYRLYVPPAVLPTHSPCCEARLHQLQITRYPQIGDHHPPGRWSDVTTTWSPAYKQTVLQVSSIAFLTAVITD